MNDTDFGDMWDISYDPVAGEDVIMIETEGGTVLYLSSSDLKEMSDALV